MLRIGDRTPTRAWATLVGGAPQHVVIATGDVLVARAWQLQPALASTVLAVRAAPILTR